MKDELDMTKKQNFLSVDGKTARNSYGEFFNVGEVVGHQDEEAGTATILSFEPKENENEITVHVTRGYAHLDFITKFPYVEKEPTGFSIVKKERKRQISVEGWTIEHDDEHTDESLAIAASSYAFPPSTWIALMPNTGLSREAMWPWDKKWWKPTPDNRIKELAKAGALIIAEIDRLLRAQKQSNNEKN